MACGMAWEPACGSRCLDGVAPRPAVPVVTTRPRWTAPARRAATTARTARRPWSAGMARAFRETAAGPHPAAPPVGLHRPRPWSHPAGQRSVPPPPSLPIRPALPPPWRPRRTLPAHPPGVSRPRLPARPPASAASLRPLPSAAHLRGSPREHAAWWTRTARRVTARPTWQPPSENALRLAFARTASRPGNLAMPTATA